MRKLSIYDELCDLSNIRRKKMFFVSTNIANKNRYGRSA